MSSTSPTPTRKDCEIPLLAAIAEQGGSVTVPNGKLNEHVRELLGVVDEVWDATHARPKWVYELQWVRYNLVNTGDLDGSKRGVWSLTEQGRARLLREQGSLPQMVGPTLQPPPKPEEIFYHLTYQDIQDVAEDTLGRNLSTAELHKVAEIVPDYLSWHEAICSALGSLPD